MPTNNPQIKPNTLLSIHIPKTGGTTLREVLLQRFKKNLYLDYGYDTNIQNPKINIEAIHTHNPYHISGKNLKNPQILTILREPLDRAISHYHFWLNLPPSEDPEPHGEIFIKHFRDNKPDLETFLLSGDGWMKNIYTEHFLYPLQHPDEFWFVGFLETFNEDIADLQKLLGMKPRTWPVLNKGTKPSDKLPIPVIKDFYTLNQKDKDFYNLMMAERIARKKAISAWTTKKLNGYWKYKFLEILKDGKRKFQSAD